MRCVFSMLVLSASFSVALAAAPDQNLIWCKKNCPEKPCAVGGRRGEPVRYCVRVIPDAPRSPRVAGVAVDLRIYNASPEVEDVIRKAIEDR